MDISKNGTHVASGLGSAVQGHPATAVAWLANTLGRYGIPFLKGEIILSGSLAPLLPALPGDRFHMTLAGRSEEHTSELQSLMRISYAVFCLKKKTINNK